LFQESIQSDGWFAVDGGYLSRRQLKARCEMKVLWVAHARMLARKKGGSGSLKSATGLKGLKAAKTCRQASLSDFGCGKFFLTI
jgi:hypothetical protein